MFLDIDLSLTPQKPKLYLCKPNKTSIASLKEHYDANLKISLTTLSELTFNLPYQIEKNNEQQYNTHCEMLKNRYLIKLILGDYTSYFIIDNPSPNADDSTDFLQVNCYSLEYELKDKNIRSYKADAVLLSEIVSGYDRSVTTTVDGISTTVTTHTNGILFETPWILGSYPESLNAVYRSFEVSVKTKLDFILEIAEKFNLIAKFDSINRKINFYTINEYGIDKGFRISDIKYLRTIVQNIDSEFFCTRLKVYGKDGLTINEINPNGQSYIENYTTFLFPFQRDEITKEVITRSDYMSDELCHKLLDYQILLLQNKDGFATYLAQLTALQIELTALTNELREFEDQMATIDDNIETEQNAGHSITIASTAYPIPLATLKLNKQLEIDNKKDEIIAKNVEITDVQSLITEIQTTLTYEGFFADTPELLLELQTSYMIDKDFTNSSIGNSTDLYFAGMDEMEIRKTPKTIVQISLVNFLEILEEQRNWGKINLGDSISIKHKQLGIDITAKIIEINFDFENAEIQLTISNVKTASQRLSDSLYHASSYVDIIDINKFKWDSSQSNATEYVDQQIEELNGSLLNLEIDITRFGSDGFITAIEAKSLKLTLDKLIAESLDIINIATQLEFLDLPDVNEKTNFQVALTTLQSYLIANWIGPTVPPLIYPIAIICDSSPEDERIKIRDLFQDVEDKKSILNNAMAKARQDDGKRYVESQIAELNTALSDFQIQVNTYINAKQITETESDALELLKTAVQDESGDIIAIADELLAIIGDDNILYDDLLDAKNDYFKVDNSSGAIVTALNSVSDWLNQDSSDYPITIKPSKGVDINKKLKIAETKKNTLVSLITQVQIDNELTLVDQQLFEVSVAITSMQMDIKTFAKDNYITYDESVSLKASFDKILAESADVINIANSLTVSTELINNYQNSLTGTLALNGVDGLQVELAKWVDLPLLSYPKKMKSSERKLLLKKFELVMSTKLLLTNAITIATPEYSVDGEISIRGTGGNHNSNRFLKLNKKTITASSISNSSNKGLMLTVISREDLSILFTQCYHTFETDEADRNALATKLNSYTDTATFDDSVIIVLTSYDSIGWNQTLLDAMIKVGGTGTDTGAGKFPFAFIGIPGLFKGSGLEVFSDSGTKAPFADIATKIVDGTPQGIAIGKSVISAQAMLAVQKAIIEKETAMIDVNKVALNTTFTSNEKKTIIKYQDIIVLENQDTEIQASYWNNINYPDIQVALLNYQNSYLYLINYLNLDIIPPNTVPILTTFSDSTIVSAAFISKFNTFYDAKIALFKAIMGVARDYIGDAVNGLAESLIGLSSDINDAVSDSKIYEPEATKLASDLDSVNKESIPLITLATSLGLDQSGYYEKTNYQTALTNLSNLLNTWIGKSSISYPFTVTAEDKDLIKTYFSNVQSTKSLLLNKISATQAINANIYTDSEVLSLFDEITGDGNLTAIEKRFVQSEWDAIMAEKIIISAKATLLLEKLCYYCAQPHWTDTHYYTPAYDALATYIATLALSTTATTPVNRVEFNANFALYYEKKASILEDIAVAEESNFTFVQSSTASDIANAVSTANSALSIANSAYSTANSAVSTANSYTDAQILILKNWVTETYPQPT